VQIFQKHPDHLADGASSRTARRTCFTRAEAQAIDKGIPMVALDTFGCPAQDRDLRRQRQYDLGHPGKEALKRAAAEPDRARRLGQPEPGVPGARTRACKG
jgi:hypothetical protein